MTNIIITEIDKRRAVQADVFATTLVLSMMKQTPDADPEEKERFEAQLQRGLDELKKYDPDPAFDNQIAGMDAMLETEDGKELAEILNAMKG